MVLSKHTRIANAVHHAVCTLFPDPARACRWYAVTGWLLLVSIGYELAVPQSGRLALQPDPDDPEGWFEMDPSHNQLGEVHCWVALPKGLPGPGLHKAGQDVELIDFSARNYARLVQECARIPGPEAGVTWTRQPPPDFIWATPDRLPPWLLLQAQEGATTKLAAHVTGGQFKNQDRELLRLAMREYAR
jgi:hypothetical protein